VKKSILITTIMLFGALGLKANPRILIDGIHGWSTPQSNMSEVMDPAEMFPGFAFDYLDAPIQRVGTYPSPIPFSPTLEKFVVPDENNIIDAVRKVVEDARIL